MNDTRAQLLISLGLRIRKLRKEKGLSQSELANMINKDQQSIQRLEKGKINPSIIYLIEIAMGLDSNVSDLINGLGHRQKEV